MFINGCHTAYSSTTTMDHLERKRAFSQAFQLGSEDMCDRAHHGAVGISTWLADLTPSAYTPPSVPFSSNKENEAPLMTETGAGLKALGTSLLSLTHRHGGYTFDVPLRGGFPDHPEPFQNPVAGELVYQPLLDSSPPGLASDGSSPHEYGLDPYLYSDPDFTIYEDGTAAMYEQQSQNGPSTPVDLSLQSLTLFDVPELPLPESLSLSAAHKVSASVYIVQTAIFKG